MISRALAKWLDAVGHVPTARPAAATASSSTCLTHRTRRSSSYRPAATRCRPHATQGYDEPTLQLHASRRAGRPAAPLARAWSAYAALQGLRYVTLDEGGEDEVFLIVCTSPQTAPANVGTDEKGRYRFTLNLALHVRALTEHRD